MNSDLQVWQRFFKDALIPAQFIQTYANKFTENRIRFDMLADLDKSLLNEMGITAIGDCLSILKHAKTIISQIEEKNKLETQTIVVTTNNNNDSNAKKRSEVAKRIIETYLSDPEAKPLNETKNNNSSSLSADLISRLNFNPNKFDDQSSQQSLVTKVIVSSTTNDDEQRNKLTKIKRKIDDVYEINNTTATTTTNKKEPTAALEYRGLLKNDSTNNDTNTISKRTSSFFLNNNNTLTTGGFKFENFKIETKNENVTEKTNNNNKKIFDRIGTLKSDSMTKPKIIPITFEKTIINKNATAANSATASVKLSNNNNSNINKNGSVFSRLSSSLKK